MKFFSQKIIECKAADIHLHYANNRGRGSDNVTITIVTKNQKREASTNKYPKYLEQYRVSGWRGHVNVPTESINEYGGLI